MKKNNVALIFGIISAIFGLMGGLLWMSCSAAGDALLKLASGASGGNYEYVGNWQVRANVILAFSIICGIGGSATTLVGAIQGYHWQKGSFICPAVGCGCQLGLVIAVFSALSGENVSGLATVYCIWTIISLVLAGVAALITGLRLLEMKNAPSAMPVPEPVVQTSVAQVPVAEPVAEETPATPEEE